MQENLRNRISKWLGLKFRNWTMEKDRPPPYEECVRTASQLKALEVADFAAAPPPQQLPAPPPTQGRQWTTTRTLKFVLPACLIVACVVVTTCLLLSVVKERTYPDPPEMANLTLAAVGQDSFTVAWDRPEGRFDYYVLEVTDGRGPVGTQPHHVGSCDNGTILHPEQTRVTCGHLDACTNATFRIRTHINGPPERTSEGVALPGIFIPGKDPDSPTSITMIGKSPALTRLEWEAPSAVSGILGPYKIRVCDDFTTCAEGGGVIGCTQLETAKTWVEFESAVDTKYCVMVTATAQCGNEVLTSGPAIAEVGTPSFAPGDFEVQASTTGSTSVEIRVFVPQVKNGALDKCFGVVKGPGGEEHDFGCNHHGGYAALVTLTGLSPRTSYTCTVTFANVHGGREVSTDNMVVFTTPDDPIARNRYPETWDEPSKWRPSPDAATSVRPPQALLTLVAVWLMIITWRFHSLR